MSSKEPTVLMDPKPTQGHARADSVVDDTDTIPNPLITAQSLCTAISSVASGHAFLALSELVDMVPRLKEDIESRDDEIKHLSAELVSREQCSNSYNQGQIRQFEIRYNQWKEEEANLKTKVEELQEAGRVKDEEITKLREDSNTLGARVDSLETEHKQVTDELGEKGRIVEDLLLKLQTAQADVEKYQAELKQSQSQAADLKQSLEDVETKNTKLKEDANKIKDRYKILVQLAVPLKDLDLTKVANDLEDLWKSATTLVETYFGQDFSEETLQKKWISLCEIEIFKHHIPLPQSNSSRAKQTRVAIILGFLARLVDKFIFQPTYLLNEESGLRYLLRRQAAVNQRKERFTRGIILSMFPDDQATKREEVVDCVIDELMPALNSHLPLASDALPVFVEKLEDLIIQFQALWMTVQEGKQKLEPSFHHSTSSECPWHVLDIQISDDKNSKNSKGVSTTNNVEDDVVIFPRIYSMEADAVTVPITYGSVLRKSQLDAAAEEVRKSASNIPFSQPTLSRPRIRPSRTMSMTGSRPQGVHKEDRS